MNGIRDSQHKGNGGNAVTEVEKKMQLTRFLREENAMNRMKVRNREDILYGGKKTQYNGKEEMPLVYDGYLESGEYGPSRPAQETGGSTFGLRVIIAVLLFGAVVYLDKKGINFGDELAAQVIARQVVASDEGKLIDFVSKFPYTLSDGDSER